MLLRISYSESTYPITPVELLKATLYDYSGISVYVFCLLYIHRNNNKFTYDKFKSAKFGFSMFDIFGEVSLKLFINTADKEIYKIYQ